MEMVLIVCAVIVGFIAVTYLVTQKKVRKHIMEISFGKIFQIKTETEFRKDA